MYLIWVIGPILASLYCSITFKDSIFHPKGARLVWFRNFARLAAFALAFYQFRLNRTLLIMFIAGMLIPFQMLMIPVFRLSDLVGLRDSYQGVILFHVAFQLGFCTFFLRNFMKQIPYALMEVPRIDGASDFLIYRRIILPISVSSMAALGLANMPGEFISHYNMTAAGSIIAAAAPLLVFLVFQRFFISGLTVGAVKG